MLPEQLGQDFNLSHRCHQTEVLLPSRIVWHTAMT